MLLRIKRKFIYPIKYKITDWMRAMKMDFRTRKEIDEEILGIGKHILMCERKNRTREAWEHKGKLQALHWVTKKIYGNNNKHKIRTIGHAARY